ncbi:YggT family protein [Umboniibacter marinipuniceus]|uniref:YggT family protein n=1 Tax=Umboniibacter marinipuniceus TaxID=569599 RepID=A0A3M0ACL6_9GAMM|nr:YggT family protein [Umboniibacter marinipuniceus]RMA82217.1 YggT family protein [Umboniibacter marinipuniceus]
MSFADIITLIVHTLGTLFIGLVVVRLLMQLAKADYYNPLAQTVMTATSPLLTPLRRLIPPVGPIDSASVVLALLLTLAMACVVSLVNGFGLDIAQQIAWSAVALPLLIVKLLWWILLITVILSWIPAAHSHPAAQLVMQIGHGLTAPIRRFMPATGGLDLSPIIAFLIIIISEGLLYNVAAGVGMIGGVFGWIR